MIHIRFSCVPSEMLARERRKVKRKMQFSCLLVPSPFPDHQEKGKEVMETREMIVVQQRDRERERCSTQQTTEFQIRSKRCQKETLKFSEKTEEGPFAEPE